MSGARTDRRRHWARRRLAALAFIVVALAPLLFWSLRVEPRQLNVNEQVATVAGWPARLDGLRVALVSDIHAGSPGIDRRKIAEIAHRVNRSRPDLILLLGDFTIDKIPFGNYIDPETIASELKNLRAPLGVFAVLGNHDWTDNAFRIWRALDSAGVTVLENDTANLSWRGHKLVLAGIADWWRSKPDVTGTLARVTDGSTVIAMMHNPSGFIQIPPTVPITFAGHTHGGQVNLPVLGRPFVPTDGGRYAQGLFTENGRSLFVTTGIGTSGLPVRFRQPPEISIVVLRHR